MKKILIAVPCMDMVSARFAQSLAMLKKSKYECALSFLIGSLVYDSRNKLAGMAVEMRADYVLWLDSDMTFQPDTLERMVAVLEEHKDISVLSGLYFRRATPFTPVLFSKLELNDKGILFEDVKDIPKGLFEVAGCGFGGVLMRTECLLDIALAEGGGQWFTPMATAGEDCAFCIRARRAGHKVYCDPSIEFGHMGYAAVTRSFYEATKGEIE